MSDPRFARLKTDPRFRKPRRKTTKVVVDDRFKSIFDDGDKKQKGKTKNARVDKYGRKLSSNHDSDNLKRFYRLEEQEEELRGENVGPDYARGDVLMESSDEEDQQSCNSDVDDGEVMLGRDMRKPITIPAEEPEIDLDESQFAELDSLAVVNAARSKEDNAPGNSIGGEQTDRLAVVNLDWDHVRASHLYKIFSSVVSPSPSAQRERENGVAKFSKGKVLNVRIYPSEFGRVRLEQEQKEGPPKDLFKKRDVDVEDDLNLPEDDDGNEYNEEALRNYQLERLRYYYGIVTCDTVDAAARIYSELDGTELERSANIFDLSFVPNGMIFDDEVADEATEELSATYKGLAEFTTDALRHSKVKLTWDNDDTERNKITRRTLSRKEIEEADFKAYLASSGSSDDGSDVEAPAAANKRDKLRALLLDGDGGENELLPEGWGKEVDKAGEMEITFTPGLSGDKGDIGGDDETTLQQYLRKQKEKRKKKSAKAGEKAEGKSDKAGGEADEFFGEDSEDDEQDGASTTVPDKGRGKSKGKEGELTASKRIESTPAELEILLTSDGSSRGPKHFDMRSVIKAEKAVLKKRNRRDKKKDKGVGIDEDEAQEDFAINVKDDRFKALHEDHAFAIDPTNPHFKKTKSMSALLEERAKHQRSGSGNEEHWGGRKIDDSTGRSLRSLIESVKRKSVVADEGGGKRRKV